MTIDELIQIGKNAEAYFLMHKGYDTAEFRSFSVRKDGTVTYNFDLYDDFQTPIPVHYRCQHEYCMTIDFEDMRNLERWPNREQRELSVLAAQLAAIDNDASKLMSLSAQNFVAGLKPQIDTLRNQITKQEIKNRTGFTHNGNRLEV